MRELKVRFFMLLSLWLSISEFGLAEFVVQKNSLTVFSPERLKGKYESAINDLGIPKHGGSLFGSVVYPRFSKKSCVDFNQCGINFNRRPGGLPLIVLVDRGDCYLSLKVLYAQKGGAAAVLIADDIFEPLITMYDPGEDKSREGIRIPSALISKTFSDQLKTALSRGESVQLLLEWVGHDILHPSDKAIKYEFWTNGYAKCGPNCERQIEFIKDFKDVAKKLEQENFAHFTPHYVTWYCPEPFILSRSCKFNCINRGRYCALDPEIRYYAGKDVVVQNLRQLCFFEVAKRNGRPWLWWDYASEYATRCTMEEKRYNKGCGDDIILSLGVDVRNVDLCMGDAGIDAEHPILQREQDAQIGKGFRQDVTAWPTLMINDTMYTGKLDKAAVLETICASKNQTQNPTLCSIDNYEDENDASMKVGDYAKPTVESKETMRPPSNTIENYRTVPSLARYRPRISRKTYRYQYQYSTRTKYVNDPLKLAVLPILLLSAFASLVFLIRILAATSFAGQISAGTAFSTKSKGDGLLES